MALELATRLILRTAADGSPLSQDALRGIVARWADVPLAASDEVHDQEGRHGSRVTTTESRLAERTRWDLSLTRADEYDDSVDWAATVTGLFEPDRTTLVVRLRRDSRDHRLRPLTGSPAPPRVVRDLLRVSDADCFDGPIRVTARYKTIRRGDVAGFVGTHLLAPDRRLPIVGIAFTRNPVGRLDATKLAVAFAGFAHVCVLDQDALPKLAREVGALSLGQASARLWWPGLALDDESAVHPSWTGPYPDPSEAQGAISSRIFAASRDRWREPQRLLTFQRDVRHEQERVGREAAARVVREIERLRANAVAERERRSSTSIDDAIVKMEAGYEAELTAMASDVAKVEHELERQRIAAEHAESQWLESEEAKERLERENLALQGRLDGLLAQIREGRDSESEKSDEELFADEVRASYEGRLTEQDRMDRPLREFIVREGFLASISKAVADRGKVVDTAMEIACDLARDVQGRALHRLRTADSGNAPERVRQSDGAIAMRCNVQSGAPSARRLHYWECPGGSIELVSVTIHDDFSIRE